MIDREMLEGVVSQIMLITAGTLILLPDALYAIGYSTFVLTGLWAYIAYLLFVIFFITGERRVCTSFTYNPSGDIAAILAFIVVGIGMMVYALAPGALTYIPGTTFTYVSEDVYFPTLSGLFFTTIGSFFQGLMMMSMGGFFSSYRAHLKPGALWLATGIVFFVGGLVSFTMLLPVIAFAFLTVSALMGALCFLLGKPKRTGVWAQ
jgi:hypothetical protein